MIPYDQTYTIRIRTTRQEERVELAGFLYLETSLKLPLTDDVTGTFVFSESVDGRLIT